MMMMMMIEEGGVLHSGQVYAVFFFSDFLITEFQRELFGFEAERGGSALRGHGIGFSETNCSPRPRVGGGLLRQCLFWRIRMYSSFTRETCSDMASEKNMGLNLQAMNWVNDMIFGIIDHGNAWNAWKCKVEGEPMHVAMDREWWTPQRRELWTWDLGVWCSSKATSVKAQYKGLHAGISCDMQSLRQVAKCMS